MTWPTVTDGSVRLSVVVKAGLATRVETITCVGSSAMHGVLASFQLTLIRIGMLFWYFTTALSDGGRHWIELPRAPVTVASMSTLGMKSSGANTPGEVSTSIVGGVASALTRM